MDEILESCNLIFDKSLMPFGVYKICVDENHQPYDMECVYLNQAMADMSHESISEVLGRRSYEYWENSDPIWLERFYEAAWLGQANEFEAVTVILEQFLHITVFPVAEGYCGAFMQDVTSWIKDATRSMMTASMGLFFYDGRTRYVMLTPAARTQCNTTETYSPIEDFAQTLYDRPSFERLKQDFQTFKKTGNLLFEGQTVSGRWMRISLVHNVDSNQFSYGFVEDITRAKAAEEASMYRLDIIDSLSRENFALYVLDMEHDSIVPFRLKDHSSDPLAEAEALNMSYSEAIELYLENYVLPADKTQIAHDVALDTIRERLNEAGGDYSVSFRRALNTSERFIELRFIRLTSNPHKIVMAARDASHEVIEQLRQKEALQSALALAQHASEAKSTFLTNMSHDFRTPMNSISGFATLALANLDDTERVRDCLQKIILSGNHLLDLVNDILDVSRVESGKMPLKEEPISLAELSRGLYRMFSSEAQARHIAFSFAPPAVEHEHVFADRLRVNQIMINVIGNALKYTPDGGNVDVTIRELDSAPAGYGLFTATVTDNGFGMSHDFLEALFLPFEREQRTPAPGSSGSSGTGLGMAITKNLVELMGGSIDVESELNKGTSIAITIPLRLQTQEDADDERIADNFAMAQAPRDFTGTRALVVDDDELSREIMSSILGEYGFITEEVNDGDEAVAAFEAAPAHHFDVIMMDMRMPRMDGDIATRAIRQLDKPDAQTIPIIAASADAFEEGRRRATEAGMTAHTTKPLNIQHLLGLLDTYIPAR